MRFDGPTDGIRFTRSISEYNRQIEEFMESRNTLAEKPADPVLKRYETLTKIVKNPVNCKSTKEVALREMRQIEREQGWEGEPYNGG